MSRARVVGAALALGFFAAASADAQHVTFGPDRPVAVGDRVRVWPAHVDPTVAYHERMHLANGDEIVDTWAVDLRGW